MSPRRRLTGIAAMSAVTLATAGIAGAPVTAEEDDGTAQLRALIEAFGGGDIPDEALTQILSQYEAMGIDPSTIFGGVDPEMLAVMAAMGGAELDESAFTQMLMGAAGGDDAFDKATPILDDPETITKPVDKSVPTVDSSLEDLFAKLEVDLMSGEELDAMALMESFLGDALSEQAFPKVEAPDEQVFLKMEDPLLGVEAALAEAVARGDIDPATYLAILELLPEE